MRAKILPKPRLLGTQCFAYNVSIRHCLHHLLPYIGREGWSYSQTMGYTAHAFHINLKKNAAQMDGTFLYDGLSFTQNAMINLGMQNEYFDIMPVEKLPDSKRLDLLDYAMNKFRQSIDKGVPFLCPKGRQPEFGLAYGYDERKQIFHVMNTKEDWELPYRDFAEGHLYAFVCDGLFDVAPRAALRRSLEIALRHSRGEDATFASCVNGLAAYDGWIGIFERRAADPLGNAASLSVVGAMRQHAAEFLRQSAETWEGDTAKDISNRRLLEEASEDYGLVALSFARLQEMFPFPSGGDPGDPSQADEAIALLSDAKTAEKSGLSKLQQIVDQLDEVPDMPAIIPNDPFFY